MCTNLYGSQKEGGNFFNLLQKEGGTQKGGGFPQKRRGPTLEKNVLRIKDFDPKLLKLDKKSSIDIGIYVTKKPEYNTNSVNPLYLLIGEIDRFIEEENGSKYLNIALTDSNNKVLKKYADVWRGIKDQIKKINMVQWENMEKIT